MEIPSLFQLKPPYDALLREGKREEYISTLCQDGLTWWFNMDIPSIICHLVALNQIPPIAPLPRRLAFLSEAVNISIPIASMETFYHLFMEENDLEAASAAAGAGAASIFDSGLEFSRFETWYQRIEDLLKQGDRISPLARASLLGFKGMVELVYLGDNTKASTTYKEQLLWAEKARSNSLRVFHAAAHGYNLLYLGDLPGMELLLSEVSPLIEHPETSLICRLYYQITQGMFNVNRGQIPEAKKVLLEVINHPLFDLLPPPVWLLGSCHFLLATALEGDAEGIESIFKKIRNRTVPEQNYFYHGYIHFSMGEASLLLRDPYRALLHGQQAVEKGRLSQSPITERVGSFLIGQALADLGRTREAMDHFCHWVEEWERVRYYLFTSAGCIELSNLLMKEGRLEEARKYYERISSFLPHMARSSLNPLRPAEFVEKIQRAFSTSASGILDWGDPETAPVRIETFGQFRVTIKETTLYDRKWQGGRTKAVLKALIVCGGTEVSTDLLIDILWPDADGDMAVNNLKVALSRLRRIGCRRGKEPLPWIVVKHRQVSLVRYLCSVDSIRFQTTIRTAMDRKNDASLLFRALDLYKDEFLANDQSELWIIRHREVLREDFIRGVKALASLCFEKGDSVSSIPYLEKAIQKDPLDENLYVQLMRAHLLSGYPGKALTTFRKASEVLKKDLDVEPGPVLTALAHEAGLKH